MAKHYKCRKCGRKYKVKNHTSRESTPMAKHRLQCQPENTCADESWIYEKQTYDVEMKSLNLIPMKKTT